MFLRHFPVQEKSYRLFQGAGQVAGKVALNLEKVYVDGFAATILRFDEFSPNNDLQIRVLWNSGETFCYKIAGL